jgi:hypothetical protein
LHLTIPLPIKYKWRATRRRRRRRRREQVATRISNKTLKRRGRDGGKYADGSGQARYAGIAATNSQSAAECAASSPPAWFHPLFPVLLTKQQANAGPGSSCPYLMLWIFQVKLVVGIAALGGIVTVFALLPTNDYLVAYAEWSKDKQVRGGWENQEGLEREKERKLNITERETERNRETERERVRERESERDEAKRRMGMRCIGRNWNGEWKTKEIMGRGEGRRMRWGEERRGQEAAALHSVISISRKPLDDGTGIAWILLCVCV